MLRIRTTTIILIKLRQKLIFFAQIANIMRWVNIVYCMCSTTCNWYEVVKMQFMMRKNIFFTQIAPQAISLQNGIIVNLFSRQPFYKSPSSSPHFATIQWMIFSPQADIGTSVQPTLTSIASPLLINRQMKIRNMMNIITISMFMIVLTPPSKSLFMTKDILMILPTCFALRCITIVSTASRELVERFLYHTFTANFTPCLLGYQLRFFHCALLTSITCLVSSILAWFTTVLMSILATFIESKFIKRFFFLADVAMLGFKAQRQLYQSICRENSLPLCITTYFANAFMSILASFFAVKLIKKFGDVALSTSFCSRIRGIMVQCGHGYSDLLNRFTGLGMRTCLQRGLMPFFVSSLYHKPIHLYRKASLCPFVLLCLSIRR